MDNLLKTYVMVWIETEQVQEKKRRKHIKAISLDAAEAIAGQRICDLNRYATTNFLHDIYELKRKAS